MMTHKLASLTAMLAIVSGLLVLVSWESEIAALKSILPGGIAMTANSAVCFILIGIAILFSNRPLSAFSSERLTSFSVIGRVCMLLAGLIGLLTLSEYLFNRDMGIDQYLFSETSKPTVTSYPVRMTPESALCFVLLAIALWFNNIPSKSHWATLSVSVCLLVLTLGLAAILSYFTPILGDFSWFDHIIMSMPNAVLFSILAITIISVSRQQHIAGWSLSNTATLAFVSGLTLLLFIGFTISRSESWQEQNQHKIKLSENLIELIENIHAEVVNLGGLDYLMTDNEQFLGSYSLIDASIRTKLIQLSQVDSSTSRPLHYPHINQITSKTKAILDWYQQVIEAKQAGINEASRDRLLLHGGEFLNDFYRTVAHIKGDHHLLIKELQQKSANVYRFSHLIIFGGTLTSLIIFLITLFRLNFVEHQRKKNEAKLIHHARLTEALLELPKLAETLAETPFMQRGQEFAEDLTGSQISFIHFVNADEETIELITWSRRTLERYCHAVHDKHYSISHAGIWADALREKKPVIFNDYAAYPNKHGLPEGHSVLKRLISLPVIENGKVVMLAGVANKATEYTDLDVEAVLLIASEIWRIVQRRRTQMKAARFSRVLEQSMNEIYVLDSQTFHFIDVNLGARTNLGYTLEELQNMTPIDINPEYTLESLAALVATLHSGAEKQLQVMTLHRRKDGTTYPVEVHLELTDDQPPLCVSVVSDITERKQTENAIRASEALFKAVSQSANDAIITADSWGTIIKWNQGAQNIFGYTESEIVGQPLICLMPDRFHQPHLASMERMRLGGEPHVMGKPVELAGLRKNQSEFPLELSLAQWQIDKQHFFTGVIRDITERKQAEKALKSSEQRFRDLVNSTDGIVWEAEASSFNFTFVSEQAERLLGYSVEEWLKPRFWAEHLHPDDKNWAIEYCITQTRQLKSHDFEYRFIAQDGHTVWLRDIVTVVTENGSLQWLRGLMVDVTERKQMEEQLRKLAQAVEQSPESIVITNLDARIEYVNEALVQSTGYSREELLGENPRILSSGKTPSETYTTMWQTLAQGVPWQGELINKHKNGNEYVEFAIITPIRQPDGRISHYVGVKEDISEKKRLTEELKHHQQHLEELVEQRTSELKEAKIQAEDANRAKSEFLANMSHEIRTPMNAILGFSTILSDLVTEPVQHHYLEAIKSSGKTLLQLINDILDLSKIEAGKLELDYQTVAIKTVFDDIGLVFAQKLAEKCIRLNLEIADNVPACLLLDEIRLRQVFLNIIGNAVKFTDKGHISVLVTAQPALSLQHTNLTITITDTGMGIAQDQLDAIFSAFTQQRQQNKSYGGTGLGLTICKRLVEIMRGTISVTSTPGKGSCFRIELPEVKVCQLPRKELITGQVLASLQAVHFQPATLLVVDDVKFNRQLIKSYLHEYPGFEFAEAETGEQALSLIRQQHFDLIFMDRRLPDTDGDSVCEQIRSIPGYKETPIIMITASALLLPEKQPLNPFYNVQLNKPVTKSELLAAMQCFLPTAENPESTVQPLPVESPPANTERDTENSFVSENLPELIRLLSSRYQVSITKLSNTNALHINAIINVAEELMQIASDYHCKPLHEWANALKNQAELFDLTNLPKTLTGFKALLNQLNQQLNTQP